MQLEFEVQRCTRRCAATERQLEPGDVCYSVLEIDGADVIRKDYCAEAWAGAPAEALGWWKSQVPEVTAKKIKLAPNDVLLELFEQLAERAEQEDMRYVLALLLLRRRVLRLELPVDMPETTAKRDVADGNVNAMIFYCPKRDVSYSVLVSMPSDERIDQIQQELSELLIATAE
jgi:hypothetical protein